MTKFAAMNGEKPEGVGELTTEELRTFPSTYPHQALREEAGDAGKGQ